MKKVEEYLEHAAECRQLARAAPIAEHRKQLEEMAKTWDSLAEVRRHELKKKAVE